MSPSRHPETNDEGLYLGICERCWEGEHYTRCLGGQCDCPCSTVDRSQLPFNARYVESDGTRVTLRDIPRGKLLDVLTTILEEGGILRRVWYADLLKPGEQRQDWSKEDGSDSDQS